MGIILTNQQKETLVKAKKWFKKQHKQTFEIAGGAGTGKTTIVYELIRELGLDHDEVLFMAYVGKATLALARKGNYAQTIHSTIYTVMDVPVKDEDGNIKEHLGRPITEPKFVKKYALEPKIKLLVVDEASMPDHRISNDILSFGLPVIALGDLNQLPPVFGNSYFLQNPDAILTEPMRQALDSPIIVLAQHILNNKYIPYGKLGPGCYVIRKDQITDKMLTDFDIVICGRNSTRADLNYKIRTGIKGIDSQRPVIGDKMICRQNNWKIPPIDENIYLINGLIGYVENVNVESFNGRSIDIDFRPEFLNHDMFTNISIDYKYLTDPKNNAYRFLNKFEFAYAITCHLSQGSEYDDVLIYDEVMGDKEYYKRWLYTAVTRAKKGLILAI